MRRQAILVLGMHRSGTSALTRVLNILGATLPKTLMLVHDDNKAGYWESQKIARFNNRLLASAESRWDCDEPIPMRWFADEVGRFNQRNEARELIAAEFGDANVIVLKDPRLCLLFPFWEKVLNEEGFECKVIMCVRDPIEVAYSLAARLQDSKLHPAAIRPFGRTLLLWLRHVLDAERSTRHLPRMVVDYSGLLSNWRVELGALQGLSDRLTWPKLNDFLSQEVDQFLNPQHRRHHRVAHPQVADYYPFLITDVLDTLKCSVSTGSSPSLLDSLTQDFDRLVSAYAPLRVTSDRLACQDPFADRILFELQNLRPETYTRGFAESAKPPVLFISKTTASRAHQYRVIHPVEQLISRGWNAKWASSSEPVLLDLVRKAKIVVVSRGPWDGVFKEIRKLCSENKKILICDIDDLIFEPDVLAAGYVEHFNRLNELSRASYMKEAHDLQLALRECDAVFATTAPLARAASKYAPCTFVLPNCFGSDMLERASISMSAPKPSSLDGLFRVGFASGTPTHTRDFGTIAEVLSTFILANPQSRLVLLGHLERKDFAQLSGIEHQIECRPAVPLNELSAELARFDINLAPLESANPFCEAKSEIRYTAASAIGIATIATSTEPLNLAVIHEVSGFIARSDTEWLMYLQKLADEPAMRLKMGEAARIDAMARFGTEKTARLIEQYLAKILERQSTE